MMSIDDFRSEDYQRERGARYRRERKEERKGEREMI